MGLVLVRLRKDKKLQRLGLVRDRFIVEQGLHPGNAIVIDAIHSALTTANRLAQGKRKRSDGRDVAPA